MCPDTVYTIIIISRSDPLPFFCWVPHEIFSLLRMMDGSMILDVVQWCNAAEEGKYFLRNDAVAENSEFNFLCVAPN